MNIKIEFMLTVFNNTHVSRFERFHKEAINYKIQRTKHRLVPPGYAFDSYSMMKRS